MPAVSVADQILAAAAERASALAVPSLDSAPQRKVAVLTCMDTRIDPLAMLDLSVGEAHSIRNAGGLATEDAIRSLAASQRLLGTEEILLIMHERCGMCGASEDAFTALLARDGAAPSWRLGAFDDVQDALARGLAKLRASPELTHRDAIRGLIFDPTTGTLREPHG